MEGYRGYWSGKGLADGAKSIDEMIRKVEAEAEALRRWRDAGAELLSPIEYDSAELRTTDAKLAAEEGFEREEESGRADK